MLLLFVLVFGCVRNYFKAKTGNLNAALWSFFTAISMFLGFFIGCLISMMIMMMKDPDLIRMVEEHPADQQQLVDYLGKTQNLEMVTIFLMVCCVGGYLFIRYLIERKLKNMDAG